MRDMIAETVEKVNQELFESGEIKMLGLDQKAELVLGEFIGGAAWVSAIVKKTIGPDDQEKAKIDWFENKITVNLAAFTSTFKVLVGKGFVPKNMADELLVALVKYILRHEYRHLHQLHYHQEKFELGMERSTAAQQTWQEEDANQWAIDVSKSRYERVIAEAFARTYGGHPLSSERELRRVMFYSYCYGMSKMLRRLVSRIFSRLV